MKFFAVYLFIFSSFSFADNSIKSLSSCLENKLSKLNNYHSISVAALDSKNEIIKLYGNAKVNQIYEIGSITKTFTGLLTAKAVLDGKFSLESKIPSLYQLGDQKIAYKDLATHTSGVIPGNFAGYCPDAWNPYEGLNEQVFFNLYKMSELQSVLGKSFSYSNIGVALQGKLTAEALEGKYIDLIESEILVKLEMNNTYFEVPSSQKHRFTQGRLNNSLWPYWDLYKTEINPAGGMRSTIGDMVKYARAILKPESTSISKMITLAQKPIFNFNKENNNWIGLNMLVIPEEEVYGHSGSTIGFQSFLLVSKKRNIALVAMTNTSIYPEDEPLNLCEGDSESKISPDFSKSLTSCFFEKQ